MTLHRARLALGLARAVWGGCLLLRPAPMIRMVSGRPPTTAATRVVRVLGCRHLAQAAAELATHSTLIDRVAVASDVLHALSAVGFAALRTTWRRGALLDANFAGAFALSSWATRAERSR